MCMCGESCVCMCGKSCVCMCGDNCVHERGELYVHVFMCTGDLILFRQVRNKAQLIIHVHGRTYIRDFVLAPSSF